MCFEAGARLRITDGLQPRLEDYEKIGARAAPSLGCGDPVYVNVWSDPSASHGTAGMGNRYAPRTTILLLSTASNDIVPEPLPGHGRQTYWDSRYSVLG